MLDGVTKRSVEGVDFDFLLNSIQQTYHSFFKLQLITKRKNAYLHLHHVQKKEVNCNTVYFYST